MILIHPYSRRLKNLQTNPKNWPHWEKLLKMMGPLAKEVVQIGTIGDKQLTTRLVNRDLSYKALCALVDECAFFIAVDSFLPHLGFLRAKTGIVLWSVSDPLIFGYDNNENLLQDRKYLRADQFGLWEDTPYNPNAFVSAETVLDAVKRWSK